MTLPIFLLHTAGRLMSKTLCQVVLPTVTSANVYSTKTRYQDN